MKRPARNNRKKIKRVYLPKKKVLFLLSIIVCAGVFLLFMHSVFAPLPSDEVPVSPGENSVSAAGEKDNTGAQTGSGARENAASEKNTAENRVTGAVRGNGAETVPEPEKNVEKGRPELPSGPVPSVPPPAVPEPVPAGSNGTLVFVFDDGGHNLSQLRPFLSLPFPVSIAVLPGLEYSAQAAELVRSNGKELLLHQPMQALNLSLDPGPGAIKQGMSADEMAVIIQTNLFEIGPVSGMNNHEGSLITEDPEAMKVVLEVCGRNDIYFLDSRTTAKSAARAEAERLGMSIWERAVFLDNSQDRSEIISAVRNGMKIAEKKGAAIMIGHVWSDELAAILTDMYPEMIEQGFSLSTIARIASGGEIDEDTWN